MANSKLQCKYCKQQKRPSELLVDINNNRFCNQDEMWLFLRDKDNARLERARNKIIKEKKKANKAFDKKVKDNDLPKQLELTQKVFNRLRKLDELKWFADRGLEPTCISCNKPNMDWCCGHLKTVGSQGALRFDEVNTYLQCNRYCNQGLSANINGNKTTRGYLQGLRERFGETRGQEIIDYCEIDRVRKWTCDELIEMRKQMNVKIRLLEKVVSSD